MGLTLLPEEKRMRFRTKGFLILLAAAGSLLWGGPTEARSVLISGPVSAQYPVRAMLESMGWTVTQVAPADFGTASFAGYDAIWLNASISVDANATFAGLAARKQDLMEFVRRGGNLLAEVKGLHSTNATSDYPFGEEIMWKWVGGSYGGKVRIVDPLNPVNAGLVNGGLGGWGFVQVYPEIGSFHGITEDYRTPGAWVTIVKQVGRGHLIYTGQQLALYLVLPGLSPHLAPPQVQRFVNNALSYPPCDVDTAAVPTRMDLSLNQVVSGQTPVGQITLSQPASSTGVVVNLSSTSPAALVPDSVTVPPGRDAVSFPITTFPVELPTPVTIVAGCSLIPPTALLRVRPGSAGVRSNLLVNGDFEEPDTTDSAEPWGYTYGQIPNPYEYRGTSVPGWQIIQGNVDLVVYDWPPAVGRQSMDLVSPSGSAVEQSFPTEPGRDYLFTGYVSHHPSLPLGRAEVLLNGAPFVALTHALPTEHTNMKWVAFAYRFRATTATTRLTINNDTHFNITGGTVLDGLGVQRDEAPNTTSGPPPGPAHASPVAPTGLAVRSILANAVSLLWDDNSSDETAFEIWRSDGGQWMRVGVVPANTTTFTDSNLTPGTRYSYGVRASNDFDASLWSNGVVVVTLPVGGPVISADTAPPPPTGLKVKG
jgi:hypothetical protein